MNRRKFVSALGSGTLLSALKFEDGPGSTALNSRPQSLASVTPQAAEAERHVYPPWPRPVIVPVPTQVAGVPPPVIDLDGEWKFSLTPPAQFWANSLDPANWTNVQVPGELTAQGMPIVRDSEYAYKRPLDIPLNAKDRKVLVRFDGVYSYTRVWVNGKFVRDHNGGFTTWDCDITEMVTPGQTAWLTVGITDRADDISYASNYAKHYIGGILRGVRMLILPQDHATRFHVETTFDSSYKDARLIVTAAMAFQAAGSAQMDLRLRDPQGNVVPIVPSTVELTSAKPENVVAIPVA
jgi:beta-galactosidase/beta-glucuronidase